MINSSPITPLPELVREWCVHSNKYETYDQFWNHIATEAARWGADQELEACCAEVSWNGNKALAVELRNRRRPKPPTLKEQALARLAELESKLGNDFPKTIASLRCAIEALPND
jgi:hypothetical protein